MTILINLGKHAGTLEGLAQGLYPREFSGIGTITVSPNFDVEKKTGVITLDHIWLHNVGSEGYTEFVLDPKVVPVKFWPHLKLWFHRHPLGNEMPGPQNWSMTDNQNIKETPLGGDPKDVKWSVSIVRTPYAWVGRVDQYHPAKTIHCSVVPVIDNKIYTKGWELLQAVIEKEKKATVPLFPTKQVYTTNDLLDEDREDEEEWDDDTYEEMGQSRLWPKGEFDE